MDDAAWYWLYMRCGLVRIARSEMQAWAANPQRRVEATTFDRTDGVRLSGVNKIERPVVAKSTDGRIWMIYPGILGLIDPANLRTNAIPPPVHVEQITANGTAFEAAPRLRLPPNVRDSHRLHRHQPGGAGKSPLPFQTGRPGLGLDRCYQRAHGSLFESPAGRLQVSRCGSEQQRRVE